MQSSDYPIQAQWVKGFYRGDQAKHVRGMAELGIGYKIIDQPDKNSVIVAFRRPMDSPLPDHLQVITDERQIARIEGRPAPALPAGRDYHDK